MSTIMQRPGKFDLAALQTNMGRRTDYISSSLSGLSVVHQVGSHPLSPCSVLMLYAVYPAIALSAVLSPPSALPRVDAPAVHRSNPLIAELRSKSYDQEKGSAGAAEESEPTPAAEMVIRIRNAFGLNVSELARLFSVERATIYGWIKGATPMPREQDKRNRLRLVYGLATSWERMDLGDLSSWKEFPLGERGSLLDMLQALGGNNPPTSDDFTAAFEALRAKQHESQTVREVSLHSSTQRYGAPSGDVGFVLDNLEWYLPDTE